MLKIDVKAKIGCDKLEIEAGEAKTDTEMKQKIEIATRICQMVIRKPVSTQAPAGTRSLLLQLAGYPGSDVGPVY